MIMKFSVWMSYGSVPGSSCPYCYNLRWARCWRQDGGTRGTWEIAGVINTPVPLGGESAASYSFSEPYPQATTLNNKYMTCRLAGYNDPINVFYFKELKCTPNETNPRNATLYYSYYNENSIWTEGEETFFYGAPNLNVMSFVPLPEAINITLKNASTIQPLTYSLNGGAAVNLNQNTQSGSVTINGDEIITINPILTTRPVTLNGTNIQGVTYGDTTHTQFPTTIPVDVTTTPTLTVNGKPAPEITIDYTNTTEPVIT